MKRLHLHVGVRDLADAVRFYSVLFAARPCCAGPTYANWRIEDPPVNFATSTGEASPGAQHFGLEVETPDALAPLDRILRAPSRPSGTMPWEVAVRKPPIRKESAA